MTRRIATPLLLALMIIGAVAVSSRGATISHQLTVAVADAAPWTVLGSGGWAQISKGHVIFYAPDSTERSTVELRGKEVLAGSPGARVVGVVAYADEQPTLLRVVRFDLYDESGRRLLTLNEPSFANVIVSPSGSGFVGLDGAEDFPRTILRFYDGQGTVRDTLPVTNFEGGRFSADGSRFFFESAGAGLVVTTSSGQVVDTIGRVDTWGASDDGTVIGVAVGSNLVFYRDGRQVGALPWPQPQERIRMIAVAPGGTHAGVVSASRAAVVRLDSLSYLWNKATDNPEWNFRSIDVAPGCAYVAVGQDHDPGAQRPGRHDRSRCMIFDASGAMQFAEERYPTSWAARFPQVRLVGGGTGLVMIDRDGFTRWLAAGN